MAAPHHQEKPSKEVMDAILQVVQGGNPEKIASDLDMDPQELMDLYDSFVKRSLQESLLGEAAKRKIGRNEPCPCGSGKKYKKCCLRKHEEARELLRTTQAVDFEQPQVEEGLPEYVIKGFDLLSAGSHEEALAYADELLSTYPEDDRLHDTLASAMLASGQYDETISICQSRWQTAKEEKAFFIEHGLHRRQPQDEEAGPPHFYSPETWLEKYWIALKAKEYASLLANAPDRQIERLMAELLTANDLDRFPAQQEEGLRQRKEVLTPTLDQLKNIGPNAIPYLLGIMGRYSWATLFVPDLLAHYSTDLAIRSLMDITMFNYHHVSEACLKHLEALGTEVLPYVREVFDRDNEFDPLKVGFINMLGSLESGDVDDFLVQLLDYQEPDVVDWAGLTLGKRKRIDLLPVLEEARSRIGNKPRITWAINHLRKHQQGNR